MADYQIFDAGSCVSAGVRRNSDGAFIPIDTNNRDYVTYVAWVDEGNTPDPSPDVPQLDINMVEESKLAGTNRDVTTHRDQTDNSHPTDLTPAQFQTLLDERQICRDNIV